MITNNTNIISTADISEINISVRKKDQAWPNKFDCVVTLSDGRQATHLTAIEIATIVFKVPAEKINPHSDWSGIKVKQYFKDKFDFKSIGKSTEESINEINSAEKVINRVFEPNERYAYFNLKSSVPEFKPCLTGRKKSHASNLENDPRFKSWSK